MARGRGEDVTDMIDPFIISTASSVASSSAIIARHQSRKIVEIEKRRSRGYVKGCPNFGYLDLF